MLFALGQPQQENTGCEAGTTTSSGLLEDTTSELSEDSSEETQFEAEVKH